MIARKKRKKRKETTNDYNAKNTIGLTRVQMNTLMAVIYAMKLYWNIAIATTTGFLIQSDSILAKFSC